MTDHHICWVFVPASGTRERGRGAPPPLQSKALPKSSSRSLCAYVLGHSVISDSATPCIVALQAPLSMGILQARILEWVAMPSSRGSSHHSLYSDPFAQKLVTRSCLASRGAGKCCLYSGWLQVHQKFGSLSSKEEEVNAH